MEFAPKTQYDRAIKGAWKSAESNPKKHEEPKKYEEKEKTNMKKISKLWQKRPTYSKTKLPKKERLF